VLLIIPKSNIMKEFNAVMKR